MEGKGLETAVGSGNDRKSGNGRGEAEGERGERGEEEEGGQRIGVESEMEGPDIGEKP